MPKNKRKKIKKSKRAKKSKSNYKKNGILNYLIKDSGFKEHLFKEVVDRFN